MTFEGKAKLFYSETSYIELITLYVHPKNSKPLRSHSRSQWIRPRKQILGKQSTPNFLRSTGLLYKFLPTNLGVFKPTFYNFYTSHLRWNNTIYHTDLGQNTVFHNFSRQIALSQYSGRSIVKRNRSKISKITHMASRFSFL